MLLNYPIQIKKSALINETLFPDSSVEQSFSYYSLFKSYDGSSNKKAFVNLNKRNITNLYNCTNNIKPFDKPLKYPMIKRNQSFSRQTTLNKKNSIVLRLTPIKHHNVVVKRENSKILPQNSLKKTFSNEQQTQENKQQTPFHIETKIKNDEIKKAINEYFQLESSQNNNIIIRIRKKKNRNTLLGTPGGRMFKLDECIKVSPIKNIPLFQNKHILQKCKSEKWIINLKKEEGIDTEDSSYGYIPRKI
jgi:ribosomal protein L23